MTTVWIYVDTSLWPAVVRGLLALGGTVAGAINGTIPRPCKDILAIRTFSTRCATSNYRRVGSRTSGGRGAASLGELRTGWFSAMSLRLRLRNWRSLHNVL